MTSDDDYDFTSTGGNYYQLGRWAPKPLELPAVDWQSRWREERDRAEKAEAEINVWRSAHDVQKKHAWQAIARAEKAEASRDTALDRVKWLEDYVYTHNVISSQGNRTAILSWVVERERDVWAVGWVAGWIAGRDAAAAEIDCGCDHRRAAVAGTKSSRYGVCQQGECLARLAAEIRALTPPKDKS